MKKPIQISIPSPCHENWDAMTPADKGRFCASCQKTVFDFTNSSDREIASVLKNTNNACGRFRTTQLDRDLLIPKEKATIWMAASAAVVSFLTIGNHTISAQTPVNTEQHVSETDDIKVGKVAAPQKRIITGTVLATDGLPVPGTNVIIKGTEKGEITDFDGNFTIEADNGDILRFAFVGMKDNEITVTDQQNYQIVLIYDEELVYMVGEIVPRRTFFGRIFHSIGNIFR